MLVKGTDIPVIICDRDHCIAAAGISKKEVLERRVTPELEDITDSRRHYIRTSADSSQVLPLEGVPYAAGIIYPIISAGDVCGSVIFVAMDDSYLPNDNDLRVAQIAAGFLGKQMEE